MRRLCGWRIEMKKRQLLLLAGMLLAAVYVSAQEAVIAPPENLIVDAVPQIPASLAETAGRYGSFRSANLADWHPVKREMLIATRFAETPQLHLVKMPEGARQQLTFFADSVGAARFHPNGGDYIVFAKDIGGGEWYQLYRYDMKAGNVTLLTDGKSRNLPGPWSSDGDRIAYMSTRRTRKDTDLWVMNPGDPQTDHLLTQLAGGGWQPEDWSPDDKKILLKEEISINESYLWLVDTTTGEKIELTPRNAAEKVSYGEARFSKNGHELGFSLNNARGPGDCYSLDVATGKFERWTTSETAVKTESFPQAELVRWKSFDGKMISGFLYKPPAKFTGKRPVLVEIHGGPEGQSQPRFLGRSNYFLNELGIALIYPNVRGSTGYGKTFSLLDNGFKREDTYKDINALFDWIATQPELDADRIAVTGGSYGGHMTLAVSTFYSDRIRCSVDVVGMSNLVTFLEHTEAYRRDLRRVEYGDERDPKMREFLEKIAPMHNIEKIKKPMFVIAGKNDPRVPVSESQQIADALKKAGTPVWLLIAKDEGHGYRKKPNQDFQFYTTVEFLQEHLLK